MGGRLSPVLAGIFMENLEQKALSACPVKPCLFKRYVDDILLIWNIALGHYNILLDLLNQQHPDIHQTTEEEDRGSLPFLDLLISHPLSTDLVTRPFSLAVYRKPMHGNRYIHYMLAQPLSLKRNILRGLWL